MKPDKRMKDTLIAYLFLAPFLLIFAVFLGYPVIYSLVLSFHKSTVFTNWYSIFTDMHFCGFENYWTLLNDKEFWYALLFTFSYGLLTIPTGIAFSLFLAVSLNNKLKGTSFFRSAYFLPNVLDILVVGVIWVLIYAPKYGLLAMVLNGLGITAFTNSGLLGNPWTCLPAIALAMVLKGAGFGMILFLTAIQNIPGAVYEAADIDGATAWQKLRYITVPLLKPIFIFLIVTGTMASLNAFSEVYAMTNSTGGPTTQLIGQTVRSANLSGFYLFKTFERGQYGYAAAMSFGLLAVALIVSYVNVKILRPE